MEKTASSPYLSIAASTPTTGDKLTFSSICRLLYDVWDHDVWLIPGERRTRTPIDTSAKRRKRDIVNLLYSLVYKDDELFDVPYLDNNRVSELFQGRTNVMAQIQKKSTIGGIHLIQANFKQRVLRYWVSTQKQAFWNGLQELLSQTTLGEDVLRLGSFKGLPYIEGQTSDQLFCTFAAGSILFALSVSALKKSDADRTDSCSKVCLNTLPDDLRSHYDPYTLSGRHSHSKAVAFQLRPEGVLKPPKVLHNHETLLSLIIKNGYIITRIECNNEAIILFYRQENYKLRRIRPKDIDSIYNFIKDHHNEFREKLSWKTSIENMAKNGLKDAWTGYAYFDPNNNVASYLDFKIRVDSDVELGIALTDEASRRKFLSTGLINFYRIKFMSHRLFSGTYEENFPMRAALENCGFIPNNFKDKSSGIETCFVRERRDPKDPTNTTKLTNSIYYYANSLLFDVRCAYKP